jgi:DNA-binding transcriptional LysR family regulator
LTNKFDKISLQKCILFHHLVKEASPAVVARKLKVPSFKVHNDLNSIEKSIGEPLIYRNQNRLSLTEAGQNFAEFCRILVENLTLVNPTQELPEELTIATTHGLAEIELPEILMEFYQEFPEIKINIVSGNEYLDFTDPSIDVVIGPHLSNRSDLSQTLLDVDPMYLYASSGYIGKYGQPKTVHELRNHRLLIFKGLKLTPKDVFDTIEPFVNSNSIRNLYALTLKGVGICVLPKSRLQSQHLLDRSIVNVIEGFSCCEVKTSFIHKRFSSKRAMTNRLYEIAKNYYLKG